MSVTCIHPMWTLNRAESKFVCSLCYAEVTFQEQQLNEEEMRKLNITPSLHEVLTRAIQSKER